MVEAVFRVSPGVDAVPRSAAHGQKYVFLGEVSTFMDRDQSVVIYHHVFRLSRKWTFKPFDLVKYAVHYSGSNRKLFL